MASGYFGPTGSIVSKPADLNDFARGYVGGELFDLRTQGRQRQVVEEGEVRSVRPGKELGIFRYETVWGHTGNYPGYTQFLAASPTGNCSVTVSVKTRPSPVQGAPGVFDALRRAEGRVRCAG